MNYKQITIVWKQRTKSAQQYKHAVAAVGDVSCPFSCIGTKETTIAL